ncbi:MAG: hypothetical protein ABI080_04820, partial [Candidatus Binatia bacterium]
MHALQLVAVVLLVSLPANGQAVPILGRQLSIQGSAFSSKPTRKTLVIARETATDVGTLSDPTMDGARFQLTTTGGTPRAEDFILDAAGWTAVKNGYRYRSSGNPPEVQVQLTKTLGGVAFLRVKLRKNATGLLPPAPGDTALLVLDVAGGERYCVSFGGAAGGTEIKDSATQWKVKNATAEPACPPASSALPECVSEFAPCGTCGDGICVAHLSGAPPYVCASQSGYSAGICSSSAECTAPRDCA